VKADQSQQPRLASNHVQYVIQLTRVDAELALCQPRRQKRMHRLQSIDILQNNYNTTTTN